MALVARSRVSRAAKSRVDGAAAFTGVEADTVFGRAGVFETVVGAGDAAGAGEGVGATAGGGDATTGGARATGCVATWGGSRAAAGGAAGVRAAGADSTAGGVAATGGSATAAGEGAMLIRTQPANARTTMKDPIRATAQGSSHCDTSCCTLSFLLDQGPTRKCLLVVIPDCPERL